MDINSLKVVTKLHRLNQNCNHYLSGLLGTSMAALIFFKILMVDLADYSLPILEPTLLVISALSTVICINGWLLSPLAKLLFTVGSLSYVSVPLVARITGAPFLVSDIGTLDTLLSGEINLTFLALVAIIAYNFFFQSFQLAMIIWVKSHKTELIYAIDKHLIPFEKIGGVSFIELNKSLKLRMLLSSTKYDMTTTLLLLRSKLPSMMVSMESSKSSS